MKILVVGAGASSSIKDVATGYFAALNRAGHQVIPYDLEGRIEDAGDHLTRSFRRSHRTDRPTPADVIYMASQGILEKALRHLVDGVLIISGMFVHPDFLVLLRRAHIRSAIVLTESPYDDREQMRLLPFVDHAWTNERSSVAAMQQVNTAVGYLRPAFDQERHSPALGSSEPEPSHDVVFVGTGFQERIDILERVDWSSIDLGLYGSWELLGPRHRLRKHLREGIIDNARTAELYRNAKIGLNLHRSSIGFSRSAPRVTGAESVNPRAVELAATGCFQISDYRAEVAEIFGDSVPTFDDSAELERRIRYFLKSPFERQSKASQARDRARGETFDVRVAQLTADLAEAWEIGAHALAAA